MNQISKALLAASIALTSINGVKAGWDGKTMPLTDLDGIAVPAVDKIPPIKQPWFGTYDLSRVPVIAQTSNSSGTANPVYASPDVLSCGKPNYWALSYDDGPSAYTDGLLSNLTASNLLATFFIVGSRAVERPDLVMKEYKLGHQVACHTWSHPYLTSLSNDQIVAEMEWCNKIISYIIGVQPRYMRPPYGDTDARVRAVLVAMSWQMIIWDFDTTDWISGPVTDGQLTNPSYNPQWITGNVSSFLDQRAGLQPPPTQGVTSLEHDLYYTSSQEAPNVYKLVMSKNYTVMPVGSCLGDSQWYKGVTVTLSTMAATKTASPATLKPATTMVPAKLATITPTISPKAGSSADSQAGGADRITPVISIFIMAVVLALSIVFME